MKARLMLIYQRFLAGWKTFDPVAAFFDTFQVGVWLVTLFAGCAAAVSVVLIILALAWRVIRWIVN